MTRILLILFGFLLIVLLGRLWIGSGSYPQIWHMEEQIKTLNEANQKQQEYNRQLEAEVEELQDGTEAVEARARNDFGMIKKGESYYQVILQQETKPTPEEEQNPATENQPSENEAASKNE